MSTPAGKSNFIKASTVVAGGSMMSIKRLCTRKSKCSPEFLLACGDFKTVQRLISVGRGIGPKTFAPERCAVVEDSLSGVHAAKNAGMLCIAYAAGGSDTSAKRDTKGLVSSDSDCSNYSDCSAQPGGQSNQYDEIRSLADFVTGDFSMCHDFINRRGR